MPMACISDPVEEIIASALTQARVRFVHESEAKGECRGLDFYLPDHDLFIEVTAYYTPRKIEQLSRAPNVILIQGRGAAHSFAAMRSEEHTSELQSLMRISYAVFCLKKKKQNYISNERNEYYT